VDEYVPSKASGSNSSSNEPSSSDASMGEEAVGFSDALFPPALRATDGAVEAPDLTLRGTSLGGLPMLDAPLSASVSAPFSAGVPLFRERVFCMLMSKFDFCARGGVDKACCAATCVYKPCLGLALLISEKALLGIYF
jgi:hypothetical protein